MAHHSWDDFPMDPVSWKLLAAMHQAIAREERKHKQGKPHDKVLCDLPHDPPAQQPSLQAKG